MSALSDVAPATPSTSKQGPGTERDKDQPSKHELGHHWSKINWKQVMNRQITADRMFMRSGLIRKDLIVDYCSEGDHPETFLGETLEGIESLLEEKQGGRFVCKYTDASNAYGMNFLDCSDPEKKRAGFDKLSAEMKLDNSPRVIQRYIEPKLIKDGVGEGTLHKFHLRALVIVVGDMDIFLYDELRVLIAPEPYCSSLVSSDKALGTLESRCVTAEGDKELSCLLHAHVTNQSFNKTHEKYVETKHNVALHECEELNCGDGDVASGAEGLWDQIRKICARTFRSLGKDKRKFMSLINTYEMFGLDFLVDEDDKAWLLEANPEPSMGMFHKTREEIEGVRDSCLNEGVGDNWVSVYSKDTEKAMEKMKALLKEAKRVRVKEGGGGGVEKIAEEID
ncbi:hypothetical protein TrVE_jg14422 [Triparma verrucosa]|uniref:Tubulin-tyrosine ligase n=1 Tax=Triparma verrucosa TaxID=1606542 RepID=A0A9W7BTX2_9STRA|nr:hypothetical protein TrVE_jg14422 [Triparma verrucosa]